MTATGGLGQAVSPQVLRSGCPLAVVQPGWGITCPYICCTVLVGLAWGGAQLVWLDTVWLATSLDEVQPLYQYLFCVVRNTYWRSWSWLGFVLEIFGCVLGLAAVMFILSQACLQKYSYYTRGYYRAFFTPVKSNILCRVLNFHQILLLRVSFFSLKSNHFVIYWLKLFREDL